MASQQVVVRVVDGSLEVDKSVRRPVRLTPDGYAGVVYAATVYPLLANNIVDLGGPSWEIEDCNRFLLIGASIPYAPAASEPRPPTFQGFDGDWHVETNRFGHYVVFNAVEPVATALVAALDGAGLTVQRWDVSHRKADDGKFYDWFARLRTKAERADVVAAVRAVFTAPPLDLDLDRSPAAASRSVEDLEAELEKLLDVASELRERLAESQTEGDRLRRRLAESTVRESGLSDDLARMRTHQKSLHDQIAELSRSPGHDVDTNALLAKQSETEELFEMALADNADLREQLSGLRKQTENDESRILILGAKADQLQERLGELGEHERERRRASSARPGPLRGVPGFVDCAFARLAFVYDSVETLANLDSPVSILRCLTRIDMGEVVGKDLEGLRGWREVSKLATGIAGSEDMGRVYYKPDGDRVLVSVHVKQDDKEQRRHIERLRTL
jgi:regulator of replication initiation timing